LLVDDNTDVLKLLAELLQLDGHEVHTAPDGPAGLDAARELRPEVVLLDVGLPGMDGFKVARQMRADPELADKGTALSGSTRDQFHYRQLK
jgi:two-component system OmpR family response regulator